MTVADIINQYDTERDNRVSADIKIRWLRMLEKQVVADILSKYDGYADSRKNDDFWTDAEGVLHCPSWAYVNEDGNLVIDNIEHLDLINLGAFANISKDGTIIFASASDDEFGMQSELVIPEPYSQIYLYYLDMKIAYNNNDSRRYNMAAQEYNNTYLAYQQYYNRTHKPDSPRGKMIQHEVLY